MVEQRSPKPSVACSTRVSPAKKTTVSIFLKQSFFYVFCECSEQNIHNAPRSGVHNAPRRGVRLIVACDDIFKHTNPRSYFFQMYSPTLFVYRFPLNLLYTVRHCSGKIVFNNLSFSHKVSEG